MEGGWDAVKRQAFMVNCPYLTAAAIVALENGEVFEFHRTTGDEQPLIYNELAAEWYGPGNTVGFMTEAEARQIEEAHLT